MVLPVRLRFVLISVVIVTRKHGLNHRQFKQILEGTGVEFGYILHYAEAVVERDLFKSVRRIPR